MNQPQLFNFHGQNVRTVTINDEAYFVGKDVAKILRYSNTQRSVNAHVDSEDKRGYQISTPYGTQEMTVINESGLYSLILSSKMPQAKEFKHWVTSEVLPAIRKHGAYMTDKKAFDVVHNANGLADLLQQAADQLKAKDIQIAEMKPKALFADAVSTSNSSILIGQLAKILRQNGVNIGQNRLFAWMRKNGYLGTRGSNRNIPTQRSMELGLFKTKETVINHSDGHTTVNITTKVTGKGQQYFINKFLSASVIEA
ncbi:phage antirepressor [Weissella confusa]|uniref:Phage repressor protein/antirepressor Ant n=1 Tax=Limosilactobacillus reuteri TaxID=1598 RepID=A0A2T5Q457_LIMRT|nr:phage antirepressor [Limosilactobacillus reuteri]MCW3764391.1 phage antirepressor [Weissella confusa]PTV04261.1 phage repressor protein/antirepressor Ant [Limosilactobacillus reuteri]